MRFEAKNVTPELQFQQRMTTYQRSNFDFRHADLQPRIIIQTFCD